MRKGLLSLALSVTVLGGGPSRAAAQLGPQLPSFQQPISLTPTLPDSQLRAQAAPIPQVAEPVRAAQPAQSAQAALPPAVMARPPLAAPPLGPTYLAGRGTGGDGVTPCADLLEKAGRLVSAGTACVNDLRDGAPRCAVVVNFFSPHLGREITPDGAFRHAREFRLVAERGDQEACRDFGGEGFIGEGTLRRAQKHYGSLCRQGDDYGCRADQMTRLCFDRSATNQCVRDCLIQYDVDHCGGLGSADDKLNCRKHAHWSCYEGACGKVALTPDEFRCINRFAGSMQFMVPPTR